MKVFFDCEFTGLHQKTTLISIGCVSENDDTFYAEFDDYDEAQVDCWIRENVIPGLTIKTKHVLIPESNHVRIKGHAPVISFCLRRWLKSLAKNVEMFSDCLAYDWVLFCELFGGALKIPDYISPAPHDINQDIAKALGISESEAFEINREEFAGLEPESKHNALWDARVIKACYEKLVEM